MLRTGRTAPVWLCGVYEVWCARSRIGERGRRRYVLDFQLFKHGVRGALELPLTASGSAARIKALRGRRGGCREGTVSTTFTTDAARTLTEEECCLCAQGAPCWGMAAPSAPAELAELALHADAACPRCRGTGVEVVQLAAPDDELNVHGGHGASLLGMLGLGPWGEAPIPEVRRAIMRARARGFTAYARPAVVGHGAPCTREDGAVELRPVRYVGRGVSAQALLDRLGRLEAMLLHAQARGARVMRWS